MRGRLRTVAPVLAALVAIAGCGHGAARDAAPACTVGVLSVDLEQAANAATIAAVGKRMGLPDRAVTVALATALQESGLRNLSYGDRDSLGLFQQRPSQGWGTAAAVQTPRLAAAAFYRHLLAVPGWQALQVTQAAQRVQHSAAPDAYAQWEGVSRAFAAALTGEHPAGFACRYPAPKAGPADPRPAALAELGAGGLARAGTAARTWTAAGWLVAHAAEYRLSEVSVSGRTWSAGSGAWQLDRSATVLRWR